MGCRAKEPTIRKVLDLLEERRKQGYPSLKLYQATKHRTRYQLVIKALSAGVSLDRGKQTKEEAHQR
jgi:hypothetical protein